MNVCAFRPQRVKIPRKVIHELKHISDLSSRKKWEYAGSIACTFKGNQVCFSKPTFVTSRNRRRVTIDTIELVWPSLISYHTHPAVVQPHVLNYDSSEIFTTLPSNSDFDVCICGFPGMQINIICDAHGYYVIDILEAAENDKIPIHQSVVRFMNDFRQETFMREHAFSEDGLEYFHTTLTEWKRVINTELNQQLRDLFGITIQYYAYTEEPPIVTIDRDSIEP